MDYTKAISPAYEYTGRRRRLTGYIGQINDGTIILHSQEYSTYHDAEVALDAIVYDLLTDLAERGLVDAVPVLCADELPEIEHASFLLNELDKAYDALTANDTPLYTDIAHVLDMALGNAPAKNVIPELRRVRARLNQAVTLV